MASHHGPRKTDRLYVLSAGGREAPGRKPKRPAAKGHMRPTEGNRREDCALYVGCLDAHLRAYPTSDEPQGREVPASCPPGCRWHEPMPRCTGEESRTGLSSLARPVAA